MERLKDINWRKHIKRAIVGVVILGVVSVAGVGIIASKETTRRANVEAAQSKMIEAKAKDLNKKLISEDEVKQKVSDSIGVPKSEINFEKITLSSGDENRNDNKGHRYKDDDNDNDNDIDDIIENRIKDRFGIDDDYDDEIEHKIKDKLGIDYDNDDDRKDGIETKRMDITQEKQNVSAEDSQAIETQPTEAEATQEQHAQEEQKNIEEQKVAENTEVKAEVNEDDQNFKPLYFVKCSANGVKYKLVLNAETGKVLSSKVK